jgi:hypothetical protein
MFSRTADIVPDESSTTHADRHAPAAAADRDRQSWCPDMPDTGVAEAPAELPRLRIAFRFRQCDKKNHGGREGRPLTVTAKIRSSDRPSPSG